METSVDVHNHYLAAGEIKKLNSYPSCPTIKVIHNPVRTGLSGMCDNVLAFLI